MNTSDKEYVEQDWLKAGKISAEVLQYGKKLIKKEATMLEVCNAIDAKIYEYNAIPAFPPQISCNEIAAHYCPGPDDTLVFDGQVCCLDVGVCVNGAIGDNALTVDLSGQYSDLTKAARDALENALKVLQPGISLGEVGKAIQEPIVAAGFAPVKNLSGHGLGVYNIHAKPSIPNFDTHDPTKLKEGDIIAIEPFASTGKGLIYESSPSTLYALTAKRPVRNTMTRDVLKEIEKYKGLPFTTRWLAKKFPVGKVNFALRDLMQSGILTDYPPLLDQAKGIVSQAEHTVLVKDKPLVLTSV